MKVFLSHSSRIKPLVREVRSFLPEHVEAWIDEQELLVGDRLETRIKSAIKSESDFLVVFLDESVARSEWVRRELDWAREEEGRLHRPFILPVLIDDVDAAELPWLADRLYLRCNGFAAEDIRKLASDLSSSLFGLLSRDLDRRRTPAVPSENPLSVLDQADQFLKDAAHSIRTIVLPHRRGNPLKLAKLYDALIRGEDVQLGSPEGLHDLLFRLRERKLLSGVVISAGTIYVEEEHLNWRLQESLAAKQSMADFVTEWIGDGNTIFVDGGSTMLRVCRNICQGVRFRQWETLTVVTNSAPAIAEFATLANELGLDDRDPRLQVYVVGGRMRMNAATVVARPAEATSIDRIAQSLGGFDIAFCGTNGITWPEGCTTTAIEQAEGKRSALTNARRRVIVADSSKYDAKQDQVFADFDMALEVVTVDDGERSRVEHLAAQLEGSPSRVIIIDQSGSSQLGA